MINMHTKTSTFHTIVMMAFLCDLLTRLAINKIIRMNNYYYRKRLTTVASSTAFRCKIITCVLLYHCNVYQQLFNGFCLFFLFTQFSEQTFIVINQNRDLFRFSSAKALWVLRPNHSVRRTAAHVLTHPLWAVFMILIILINCIFSQVPHDHDFFVIPWE